MRLLIDCQIFQTPAWDRGMGKYSLDLLSEVFSSGQLSKGEKVLIFSKNLSKDPKAISAVKDACPGAKIIWLDLKLSAKSGSIENESLYNQKILDNFIGEGSRDVFFLTLSVFQKPICPALPSNSTNGVLFYDLIPLLYHQKYKPDDNYLSRLRLLLGADLIFTISQTVLNDLNTSLGIPISKMINIDGAPIKRNHSGTMEKSTLVQDKYILMPTGDDVRKNNILGVKGFEEFRGDKDIKLVLTSKFEPHFKVELEKLSKNLLFVGNVTEEELALLYAHSEMLLFPSEYEGLGLPVLEAVVARKKVACSDIPVFQEMSKTAFYYFDYHDSSSIAEALHAASDGEEWSLKRAEYKHILDKYSWERTAEIFVNSLENLKAIPGANPNKLKVAVFAPIPSGYSAIGKVVAELHPAFADEFSVDYYFELGFSGKMLRPNYLHFVSNVYDAKDFDIAKYREYDAVIYHIGNSEYHLETIKNALYLPGYIIVHDTHLDGVFNELQKHGYISAKRNELERIIDGSLAAKNSRCAASLANSQLGLLVHSEYAKNSIREILTQEIPVKRTNLPVATPSYSVQDVPHKLIHIGLAGILTERKGLDIIEQIVSSTKFDNCIIDIFGFNYGQRETLDKLSKYPNVNINTNLSDFEYQSKLEQLDILINYRHDYRGETSLTALEAMRYGTAVIVRNIGWFSELPEGSVMKVDSTDELISKLSNLVADEDLRSKVGQAAQRCTKEMFSPEQYVNSIKSLILNKEPGPNERIRQDILNKADFSGILKSLDKLSKGK